MVADGHRHSAPEDDPERRTCVEAGLGQDRDQLGRKIRRIIKEGRGDQEVRRAPGALQYQRGREPGRRQGRRELAHCPVLLADILQRVR